jgi:hypothetical protein
MGESKAQGAAHQTQTNEENTFTFNNATLDILLLNQQNQPVQTPM